jgi:hypothetical protein
MWIYPSGAAVAVTPSDAVPLAGITKFLFIGGAGNLTVTMSDGVDAVFTGILAGTLLPIRCKLVKTATTCTNMTAMF